MMATDKSTTKLTTNIMEVTEDDTEDTEMGDSNAATEPTPDWILNARGLVYMDDYDGFVDPDAEKYTPPTCGIDETTQSVYQCIKCGNKQFNQEDIHRMKCTRCYNKAFNKVRPTKWVKFKAT